MLRIVKNSIGIKAHQKISIIFDTFLKPITL